MKYIDLRSDTVTQPTEEMRQAMARAEVGDDVYGEDPTVRRLEEKAAELFGKEAALLVPSGTMGNQLAVLAHTQRGDEVIVEAEAHVFFYEVGGLGALAGVQTRTIRGEKGVLPAARVREAIRLSDIHFPRTALICLENTHNRAGGTVMGLQEMEAIGQIGKEYQIPIHLDGARIFNAATYLGLPVKVLTKDMDSVMFCLSKGLAAPIGSMLVGSAQFIARARRLRKMLGGGMRQAGIIAAAGMVALETMVERLAEDHRRARQLAEGLAAIPGLKVDLERVQTNIVVADIMATGLSPAVFLGKLKEQGVLAAAFGGNLVRFVTHKDIDDLDIDQALMEIERICRKGR
ncbi:L-threonine aldolase [Carboxydocella sporoproducens DSM 16521]|uniref:L-threonine aldolase n=2 Tax=Carboxydocella TaxID=178898 RepID=A0A1T4PRQ4_9FIRM|nr:MULTISPECIES: low-specificity L-threonine aldolase [Carboxydocella]AVX19675.1 L-threonine aldolase [Carboxydocella thermautotrophica]AVX30080.1 L-threonine aldolase [Carboxydocella thermautotrophica]SJZ94223.1 L-threonine aldolase [Carboxydocella sporoproducens DSM 16521]